MSTNSAEALEINRISSVRFEHMKTDIMPARSYIKMHYKVVLTFDGFLIDKQTRKEAEIDIQIDRQTDRQAGRQAEIQTGGLTDGRTGGQTDRKTDR